jgi:hypothetical protein
LLTRAHFTIGRERDLRNSAFIELLDPRRIRLVRARSVREDWQQINPLEKERLNMTSDRWSKPLVLCAAVGLTVGGFLVGSSRSQEIKAPNAQSEVGRYQISHDGQFMWDTTTGRWWQKYSDGSWGGEQNPPWLKAKSEPE